MTNPGRKIEGEEIKQIELQILLHLDALCKEKGLRYYLCGGTLLGAVRHKGFIPWDDDIDVLMPREDFETLLAMEQEQTGEERYAVVSWRSGKSIYPFLKLVDTHTLVKEDKMDARFQTSIWIDVFPLDGMPDDEAIIRKKYRQMYWGQMILLTAYGEAKKGASAPARLIKHLIIPIMRRMNNRKVCEWMNRVSSEYPVETSPFVGGILWGYGPQEKMPKSFLDPVPLSFEGHELPAPSCWDYYLTQLYGNYMELPPEDKRERHNFLAWWKEEET